MNSSSNHTDNRTALYDPVPAESTTGIYGETQQSVHTKHPHRIEQEVHRVLTSIPGVEFASLSIHRMADGVCIDGVVKISNGDPLELTRIALQVSGVNHVLNHLTTCNHK